jgi:hypothetical protein
MRAGLSFQTVQRSRSDERRGISGDRIHFWSKDLDKKHTNPVAPTLNTLESYIDVDYYVDDMPRRLAEEYSPKLLYTVTPESVSSSGEASHTFDKDGNFVMDVTPGARYKHKLWSWTGSQVLMVRSYLFWFIPWRTAVYQVDTRRTIEHRSLVLLSPVARYTGLTALLASLFLEGERLEHLNPVVPLSARRKRIRMVAGGALESVPVNCKGRHLRLRIQRKDGFYVSTGRAGMYASATIPIVDDDRISLAQAASSSRITVGLLKSMGDFTDEQARVLVDYHMLHTQNQAPVVAPVETGVRHYQPVKGYDPDAPQCLIAFMSPIVDGAFTPALSTANARLAVQGRVINPSTRCSPTTSSVQYGNEFVSLVVGEHRGRVHPLCIDEVAKRQPRPGQRSIMRQALNMGRRAAGAAVSFIKKEAYGKPTEPRLITIAPKQDKIRYLAFVHAFTDVVMKKHAWYASGKTPIAIARRVAAVCTAAKSHVIVSDYSRWDGHVTELIKDIQHGCLLASIAPEYRAEASELCRGGMYEKVYLRSRHATIVYDSKTVQQSGRADTSVFGSIGNAYISYVGLRMSGLDAPTAWKSLGVYLGDDGLVADLKPVLLEKSAKVAGQVLTSEVYNRGQPYVNFLARYYSPSVWTGSLDSCSDIHRQLAKLHTTPRLGFKLKPEEKLAQKVISLAHTDLATPVLGFFAAKGLQLGNIVLSDVSEISPLRSWSSRHHTSVQYPNTNHEGWMDDLLRKQFPTVDFRVFDDWLATCGSFHDLLSPPVITRTPAKPPPVAMVSQGEVIRAKKGPASVVETKGERKRGREVKEKKVPKKRAESKTGSVPQTSAAKRDKQPRSTWEKLVEQRKKPESRTRVTRPELSVVSALMQDKKSSLTQQELEKRSVKLAKTVPKRPLLPKTAPSGRVAWKRGPAKAGTSAQQVVAAAAVGTVPRTSHGRKTQTQNTPRTPGRSSRRSRRAKKKKKLRPGPNTKWKKVEGPSP